MREKMKYGIIWKSVGENISINLNYDFKVMDVMNMTDVILIMSIIKIILKS